MYNKLIKVTAVLLMVSGTVFAQATQRVKAGVGYSASASSTPAEFKFEQAPGNNLILNGTFASDTNWTKGTAWTINGGVATYTNNTEGLTLTNAIYQGSLSVSTGSQYRLVYTISGVDADTGYSMTPSLGNSSFTARSANGTYTEDVYFAGTAALTFTVISTNATTNAIDNVYMFEKPDQGWVDFVDLNSTSSSVTVYCLFNCDANDFTNAYNQGRCIQLEGRGSPLTLDFGGQKEPIYNMWYRTATATESFTLNAR